MPRNVEIKAKVANYQRISLLARQLTGKEPEILLQEDVFYKVSSGRLKLRKFQDGSLSQLISYSREDAEGPKLSDFKICPVNNPHELDPVLTTALGQIGSVKKTRHLYIHNQTRIHIDQVENLGNFVELEVVLKPEQTLEQGQEIAEALMVQLEINKSDLISGAYLDLLAA